MVPGETGVLVRPGDISALESALRECLEDRARTREMGKKARSRVMTRFSKQAMVDKTEALLIDSLAIRSV